MKKTSLLIWQWRRSRVMGPPSMHCHSRPQNKHTSWFSIVWRIRFFSPIALWYRMSCSRWFGERCWSRTSLLHSFARSNVCRSLGMIFLFRSIRLSLFHFSSLNMPCRFKNPKLSDTPTILSMLGSIMTSVLWLCSTFRIQIYWDEDYNWQELNYEFQEFTGCATTLDSVVGASDGTKIYGGSLLYRRCLHFSLPQGRTTPNVDLCRFTRRRAPH